MVLTPLLAMLLNGLTAIVTHLATTPQEHLATHALALQAPLIETDMAARIPTEMDTQTLMPGGLLLAMVQMHLPLNQLNGLTKTVMAMAITHLVSTQILAHRFMAHQPS